VTRIRNVRRKKYPALKTLPNPSEWIGNNHELTLYRTTLL
jgi:hypothetical protein